MQNTPDKPETEQLPAKPANATETKNSAQLLEMARADADTVLKDLGTQLDGLSDSEAAARLNQYGSNEIAREKRQSARPAQPLIPRFQCGERRRSALLTQLVKSWFIRRFGE